MLGSSRDMSTLTYNCKLLHLVPFSLWSAASDWGRVLCLVGLERLLLGHIVFVEVISGRAEQLSEARIDVFTVGL